MSETLRPRPLATQSKIRMHMIQEVTIETTAQLPRRRCQYTLLSSSRAEIILDNRYPSAMLLIHIRTSRSNNNNQSVEIWWVALGFDGSVSTPVINGACRFRESGTLRDKGAFDPGPVAGQK